jgi:hypothetical protein
MEQRNVSEKALIGRINRALYRENQCQQLHKSRQGIEFQNLGAYYIVDHNFNTITSHFINDLEDLGREMSVLKKDEKVIYPS